MGLAPKVAVVGGAVVVVIVFFLYAPVIPMDIVPCLPIGHGYASPSYYLFTHGEIFLQGAFHWMDVSDANCR